jgi:hypothetical protein
MGGHIMDVSIKDASQYFRGLLILIRRDGIVTSTESDTVARLGAKLGFNREFCVQAIEDILANSYVGEEPPIFESPDLARKFVKDGLRLATAERPITASERLWLERTAEINSCDKYWFTRECIRAVQANLARRSWEYDSLSVIHGMKARRTPVSAGGRGSSR